jgi:hypothetical protein
MEAACRIGLTDSRQRMGAMMVVHNAAFHEYKRFEDTSIRHTIDRAAGIGALAYYGSIVR